MISQHKNPIIVSYSEEEKLFMVSTFFHDFLGIMTEAGVMDVLKALREQRDIFAQQKRKFSSAREEELAAIESHIKLKGLTFLPRSDIAIQQQMLREAEQKIVSARAKRKEIKASAKISLEELNELLDAI